VTGVVGVVAVVLGVGNLTNTPRGVEAPRDLFKSAVPASSATPAASRSAETAAELATTTATADPAAAPAPAAAPSPMPATFESLLADPEFIVGTDAAIGQLLMLWGAHYDSARGEPCVQAQEQGLRCLFQRRGSLGELRRVNWPTILSLVTADGTEHPVVVAALGYDHARISANGKDYELPLAELSYYWFGDHLLLWRPGDAPARDLAPGTVDEGVRWLRATLAQLDGRAEALETSTTYDGALEQRVRAYQRAHQLTVDGIVGARTQVAMLAELKLPDTPSLGEDH
jgi:general secretion pathway protein A